jgi:pimeloyl-ACP methyl ester carboxylesterase
MSQTLTKPEAEETTAEAPPPWMPWGGPFAEYVTDAAQRTILFWDVLRRRSEQYVEHKAMEVPHVLSFDCDLILDGREMEPATNYLLVRIRPPEGIEIDRRKRPFVVVDPRAGHGPGIGGFKADSEIGVAQRAGHVCYFIGFCPDPVPGQTMEDVMRAEEIFLEKVIELEPEAEGKPCVIGNCQAGWAVMMLAAVRPDLFGPIIVPGSPLSYWAGVRGENPMRYLAGVLGGSWLAALSSDLGAGTFDGGYLVENFEQLNPANTYWTKSYNLWSKVDTEADRFLGFEKWWGGHVNLNGEEIQWIVDQLFIGNRLATAEITTSDGRRVDLRNIRSPILCFCSEKDDITPPQQSLGWIVDCYEDDEDILANEQTIVYAIHPSVGHLGIFVSGGVAKKEHQEFTSNIDLIDILPPGIFEAIMIPKEEMAAGADLATGDWVVRLEKRTLDDVRAIVKPDPDDERRFATVRRVSETNLGLYRSLLQPLVQTFADEEAAGWMHKLRPAELPYELFSESNPLMREVARLAEQVREQRVQRAPDNPFVRYQEMVSSMMVAALDQWRDFRDASLEQIFLTVYGNPILQALVGLKASDEPPRRRPGLEPEEIEHINRRIAEIKARIAEGGAREAAIRGLVYITMAGTALDERRFEALKQIRAEQGKGLTLEAFKRSVREEFFALLLDPEKALDAIPKMVSEDPAGAKQGLEAIRRVVTASGELEGEKARRLEQIEKLFGGAAAPAQKKTKTLARTES